MSIGVIGLYVAFAIPIFLRWKAGDSFLPGGWTLGKKYKWMCLVAVAEIAVTSIIALLPTSSARRALVPGLRLAPKYVNYTPIVVVGRAARCSGSAGTCRSKNWFTGPKTTIDLPAGMSAADEIALEHHQQDAHPQLPDRAVDAFAVCVAGMTAPTDPHRSSGLAARHRRRRQRARTRAGA